MDKYFLPSLVLTIGIETAVLYLSLKIFSKSSRQSISQILFAGFLASFATLPYLWFVLPIYLHSRYNLWVGEAGVTLIEMLILARLLNLDWRRALLISFLCNSASFLIGDFLIAKLMN